MPPVQIGRGNPVNSNPVTIARQKKRLAKRKANRQNRK